MTTATSRAFAALSLVAIPALCGDAALAQGTPQGIVLDPNLLPMGIGLRGSGSADRLSPQVTGADFGADEVVGLGQGGCALPILWPLSDLGLAPGSNVDAFTEGRDRFPAGTGVPGALGMIPPFAAPPWVVAGFSVDRTSIGIGGPSAVALGLPESAVYAETKPGGDGAASDTFVVQFSPDYIPPRLNTDYECVTRRSASGPIETDIDAITQYELATYPVFYSIDSATSLSAILYGTQNSANPVTVPVGPADIVMVNAAGATPWVLPGSLFGLVPGDDIDALAIDSSMRAAAFSLTRTSPTVTSGGLYGPGDILPMGGAGVFLVSGLSAVPTPMIPPEAFGLLATDELNAFTIGDPWEMHQGSYDLSGGDTCSNGPTSVWRAYDVDPNIGYRVFGVQVGAHEVQGANFQVTVNLYGSSSPDPNDPKTWLGGSSVNYPDGTTPGSIFDHPFDGVLCQEPFLWVEMSIPNMPNASFKWAATDSELDPTFYSDCNTGDIAQLGNQMPCLIMSVHGHLDEPVEVPMVQEYSDLTLLHTDLFEPSLNWGGAVGFQISGLAPTEIVFLALSAQFPEPLGGFCLPHTCLDVVSVEDLLVAGPADNQGVAQVLIHLPLSPPPGEITIFGQALTPRGAGLQQSVKSNVLPIVIR